ncbi:MAG: hypothetical protein PHE17_16415 [Thiothrix sp.]|uniref:hypothetical protein n=1 Tax=Thiothrix sp. TaxID=1032 RepID=UPI00261D628C|nr:hypothetical protein [Thiothrix sp.]MDD5394600.1 hypothetical protein [Thiothrix sp.]
MNMVAVFDEVITRKPAASEWLAWACLMRQTFCWGKVEDDLADSRLDKLTGLRRDRTRVAVRKVVGMGLFETAGKGKYGTVYRIPERFLDDSGYIGFSANIGASETDAYAYPEDEGAAVQVQDGLEPEQEGAYAALATEHQQLLAQYGQAQETIRALVNATQDLVETNRKLVNALPDSGKPDQVLVNALPSLGEPRTNSWSNAHQDLVTDINKPLHNITPTNLNPDSGEEAEEVPERWPEHWGQVGKGGDGFQAWEEYAAMPAPSPAKLAAHAVPTPATGTGVAGMAAAALQYPPSLTAAERTDAPKKLDGLHPQVAQEVLDALAWKLANATPAKPIKSPIGLLVHIANKAREGTFDRTPALEWRKGQQVVQAKQDGITLVELNNLAAEIKETQRLYKASGQEVFFKQAEAMKATYFQKLDVYKAAQAGIGISTLTQGASHG